MAFVHTESGLDEPGPEDGLMIMRKSILGYSANDDATTAHSGFPAQLYNGKMTLVPAASAVEAQKINI